jgi:hypothetical protein
LLSCFLSFVFLLAFLSSWYLSCISHVLCVHNQSSQKGGGVVGGSCCVLVACG